MSIEEKSFSLHFNAIFKKKIIAVNGKDKTFLQIIEWSGIWIKIDGNDYTFQQEPNWLYAFGTYFCLKAFSKSLRGYKSKTDSSTDMVEIEIGGLFLSLSQ